jgi:polar amino acid transport system substrate-binding protein
MNSCDYRSSEGAARRSRLLFVLSAVAMVVMATAGAYAMARQGRRTVWDGIYNEGQATRGKQLYVGNCSVCHQEGLQGSDDAPTLKGDRFVSRWSDSTVDDIFTAISTSMPATAPGSLAPQQYVDIVTYLLQQNSFPAGKEEIKADPAVLKTITITKQK